MEMSVTGGTDKWRGSSIWRLQHYTGRPDSPLGRADMTAHRVGPSLPLVSPLQRRWRC